MRKYFLVLLALIICSCSPSLIVDDTHFLSEHEEKILSPDSVKTRGQYGDFWIEGMTSVSGKSMETFYLCAEPNWLLVPAKLKIYVIGNAELMGGLDGIINLYVSDIENNDYKYPFTINFLDDCGFVTIVVEHDRQSEISKDIMVRSGTPTVPNANIQYYVRENNGERTINFEIPRTSPISGNLSRRWVDKPDFNDKIFTYTRSEEMAYNFLYYYIPPSEQVNPGEPEYVPVYVYTFKYKDGVYKKPIDVTFYSPAYSCDPNGYFTYSCMGIDIENLIPNERYGFLLPEGDASIDGDIIKGYGQYRLY